MAAVAGQGTTFNLPNFVGELFNVSPTDTPFLSMIGGLTGGKPISAKQFSWQTEDNAAAAQTVALEGADPDFESRDRTEVYNTTQIMQYGVEVSYTKQAATGAITSGMAESILGNQPVGDELSHQLMLKVQRAARDLEFSFLQGTYAVPADNVTKRQTRGILQAITTNDVAAGAATLSKSMIDDALRALADAGAPFTNLVLFANSFNKQQISNIYGFAPESRNVGGVNIDVIETDFARVGVVYDRFLPADDVALIDVSHCAPCFLPIPGKGHFFAEPLAKTGSSEKWHLYGEVGLEYGPEQWHAKITNTATS